VHVAVCIKQVPDPQAPAGSFYVDAAANAPRWSPPVQEQISTFDVHAIEAAAQLRQPAGARVTVLSLGGPAVEAGLRRALAMGCDEAVRLSPGDDLIEDRLEVAGWLAAAIRRLEDVDLVLCGRIAADWDMGHVPPMLAELLGFAVVTPVIALEARERVLRVRRLTDEGYEVLDVTLPAVLAVSNEVNEPGYPTMRAVLAAQRAAIRTWEASDLGVPGAGHGAARLKRLAARDLTRECQFVDGEPEDAGRLLADVLRRESVLPGRAG
jgi:electron transfer flavoprotein beta subunit